MLGFKPDHKLWAKVNAVIMGESAAKVLVTFQCAECAMLIQAGVCKDETEARVHLAAMLLSPDTSDQPGSLLPLLQAQLDKLNDGKYIT